MCNLHVRIGDRDGEELHCDSTGTFTKEKRLDLSWIDLMPLPVFFEHSLKPVFLE